MITSKHNISLRTTKFEKKENKLDSHRNSKQNLIDLTHINQTFPSYPFNRTFTKSDNRNSPSSSVNDFQNYNS